MKTYQLILSDNIDNFGHYKVSVVKDPAVELTLTRFSKEKSESLITFTSEEKRVIYAVAMRPNILIPRNNIPGVNEPGWVYYTPETVEQFQQNYFKKNGNSATNINHSEIDTTGVFPFESWIVKDKNLDKSKAIGMTDVENGDLIMAFKIDNDDIWNECKNGNLDGLSIEAFFGYKESIINKFNKEHEMKWKEFFKSMFGKEPVEIAPGFFAKDSEVGTKVFDKDGEVAANAKFEIDSKPVTTDESGEIKALEEPKGMTLDEAIAKIAELEKDLAAEKTKASTEAADKIKVEEGMTTMKAEKETVNTALVAMTKERDDFKTKHETEAAAFAKFKAENGPLKPVKNDPPADDMNYEKFTKEQYAELDNFSKMKFNRDYAHVAKKFK